MVRPTDHRLVVARHENLEGRHEVEILPVKEPCGEGIVAGHLLDEVLRKPLALFRLHRSHEAGTPEPGNVVRRRVVVALHERLGVCRGCVVPKEALDDVEEGAFPVCPGAVEDEHRLLAGVSAHRPPCGGLEEVGQLRPVAHDLPDKLPPHGAAGPAVMPHVRHLGYHVLLPVGEQRPRLQVDCPVLHVEEPRVPVKVAGLGVEARDPACRLHEGLPSPHRLALDGVLFDVKPVPVICRFVQLGIDVPHHLQPLGMDQRPAAVNLPVGALPDDPLFPWGDIPDALPKLPDQPPGIGGIRELKQPLLKLLDSEVNRLIPDWLMNILFFHENSFI